MNGHDRVRTIVLPAEHLLDLGRFDFGFEGFERALQIGDDVLAALRPFEQHGQIVEFAGQRIAELDFVAQPAAPSENLLCVGLVLPEVGSGDPLFDGGKLAVRIGGVKDNSAGLWRV
jgi:hypothetical protein